MMRNKRQLKIFSLIAAGILAAALVLFLSFGSGVFRQPEATAARSVNSPVEAQTTQPVNNEMPFLPEVFNASAPAASAPNGIGIMEIIIRLFLAVILSAVLAFRPRKNVRLFERNLYVAQTQILLAVVAAALMMIVGDNAARAFAIFAAVSLVRFRTNIRDPKEVTVLLVCLALGLAAGIGRWELGAALCLFVLVLLRLLEYKEPEQAVRPMEISVKTRNIDSTQKALQSVFDRYRLVTEVRQIDAPDEANPVGCIVYYLNLRLSLSTDYLSEQIIALDRESIEGIQWVQKKSATDIYQ